MYINTNISAEQALGGLLVRGAFTSQVEAYLERTRKATGFSWYNNLVKAKGSQAADARLEELTLKHRIDDFANSIAPVARGMLALARADKDGEFSHVVELTRASGFPLPSEMHEPVQTVVIFNRAPPRCACQAPPDSDVWSPDGRLGLKALTLEVGIDYNGNKAAQLGLVLPMRARSEQSLTVGAFVVATFDLAGQINGHTLSPQGFDRDSYLKYSLGLLSLEEALWQNKSHGGAFDDVIGFPGATNFLADKLPKLDEYLKQLAAALTEHEHK